METIDYNNPDFTPTPRYNSDRYEVPCFLKESEGKESEGIATVEIVVLRHGNYTILDYVDLGLHSPDIFDSIEADVMDFMWSNFDRDRMDIEWKF